MTPTQDKVDQAMPLVTITVHPNHLEACKSLLVSLGWKEFRYTTELVSPGSEYCIDLSGDNGFVWSLMEFTDGDVDGVSQPRFRATNEEGDTYGELVDCLRKKGMV